MKISKWEKIKMHKTRVKRGEKNEEKNMNLVFICVCVSEKSMTILTYF